MDSCDRRVRAYKNGKTFDQCRDMAESMNPDFKKQIEDKGKVLWTEILTQLQTLFIAISIPVLIATPYLMAKKLRNADGSCKIDPTK